MGNAIAQGWMQVEALGLGLQRHGVASISAVRAGGVAYSADVGGFLAGLLLVSLFAQPRRVDRMRVYHGS
jgi:membrane associated rhomboid family serine protease